MIDSNTNKINDVSRISSGSIQNGDLYTVNDIRVDGVFVGNLTTSSKCVIGENAYLKGDIICSNLDVGGQVVGNVYVLDTLYLKSSSNLVGNMTFNKFHVEIGAEFIGSCEKSSEEEFNKCLEAMKPIDPRTDGQIVFAEDEKD